MNIFKKSIIIESDENMALIKWAQINGGTKLDIDVKALVPILKSAADGGTAQGNANGASLIGFAYQPTSAVSELVAEKWSKEAETNVIKYDSKVVAKFFTEDGSEIKPDDVAADYSNVKSIIVNEAKQEFTVAETLQALKDSVKKIEGDGSGTSLSSLQTEVDTINKTVVKDYVRLTIPMVEGTNDGELTVDGDYETPEEVTSALNATGLKLYNADNLPVYVKNGDAYQQATYQVGGTFTSAVFYVVDATATAAATAKAGELSTNAVVYKPITGTPDFKAFGVAEYKISELATQGLNLLDNQEMQMVAYENQIAELTARIGKDEALRAQIANAIGTEAIQAQLAEATNTISARIKSNEKAIAELQNDISDDFVAQAKANLKIGTGDGFTAEIEKPAEGADDTDYKAQQANIAAEVTRLKKEAAIKVADVTTAVRDADHASDEFIPTEKAVRTAIASLSSDTDKTIEALETRVGVIEGSLTDAEYKAKALAELGITTELPQPEGYSAEKEVKSADDEAYEAQQASIASKIAGYKAEAAVRDSDITDAISASTKTAVEGKSATYTLASGISSSKVASEKAVAVVRDTLQRSIDEANSDIKLVNARVEKIEDIEHHAHKLELVSMADGGNCVAADDAANAGEKTYTITLTGAADVTNNYIIVRVNGIAYSSVRGYIDLTNIADKKIVLTSKNFGFKLDTTDEIEVEYVVFEKALNEATDYDNKLYVNGSDHAMGPVA